ncbi:MAG: hypothetical protein M1814_003358 [Vezdaea aestivalis]|nr:MAG: hypothetical protein M1814_003358 [Vezdaea aestivalis]
MSNTTPTTWARRQEGGQTSCRQLRRVRSTQSSAPPSQDLASRNEELPPMSSVNARGFATGISSLLRKLGLVPKHLAYGVLSEALDCQVSRDEHRLEIFEAKYLIPVSTLWEIRQYPDTLAILALYTYAMALTLQGHVWDQGGKMEERFEELTKSAEEFAWDLNWWATLDPCRAIPSEIVLSQEKMKRALIGFWPFLSYANTAPAAAMHEYSL